MAKRQGLGLRMKLALGKGRVKENAPSPRFLDASLLMSPSRRAIFTEVCRHPCLSSGEIAKNLNLSRSNVEWHLGKMVAAKLITRTALDGCVAFYATDQISDSEVKTFTILGNPIDRKVYLKVKERPGINQSDLSKATGFQRQMLIWHLDRLVHTGLITKMKAGRLRLYRASGALEKMSRDHATKTSKFKGALIRTLKADHVEPSIVKVLQRSILLRIGVGERRIMMEVITDPYSPYVKARKR